MRSRQSLFGYVWMLVLPLLPVALFTALASYRVLDVGETALPYPLFALCNVTLWQLFAASLIAVTASLANAGSLVTRLEFPRECVLVAALGQPLLEFVVRVPLIAAAFAWYGIAPGVGTLLVLPLLVPLLLLALGLGFVLAIFNLVVRDAASVLGIALTIAMLLAPVLYAPPSSWPFALVNVLNPVGPFLVATQQLLAGEAPGNGVVLALASVFAGLVFVLGWRLFALALPRVLERA